MIIAVGLTKWDDGQTSKMTLIFTQTSTVDVETMEVSMHHILGLGEIIFDNHLHEHMNTVRHYFISFASGQNRQAKGR